MVANLCSVGGRSARRSVRQRRAVCLMTVLWLRMPAAASADDRDACLDNTRPVADAGPNRTDYAGATITFDGTASYDPDGRDLNYYIWYFGDGQVGRGAVVSHTYHQPGTYVVTLTVTDACRTRGSDVAIVTITGESTDPGDPCDGNLPPKVYLSGSPSAVVGTGVLFNASGSRDNDGNIDSYEWDFGDGATDTGPLVGHIYQQAGVYTVTVTVTDDCGDSSQSSMTVTVAEPDPCADNAAPNARATVTGLREPGLTLWFSAATSTDADGWIASYAWDFGDGASAAGRTVPHIFEQAGTYTVVLTVEDNCGASSQFSIPVTLVAADPCEGNQPPVARAGANRAAATGEAVNFDAGSSADDGVITSFRWTFGDGASATGRAVSHAFASAGSYTVTLTVEDDCGASSTDSVVVTVTDPDDGDAVVDASFTFGPANPRVQDEITFHAAQAAPFAGDLYFRWDFGDGSYPGYGGAQVTRAFADAGAYTVTLTLIDKYTWQVVDTHSETVEVSERLSVSGLLTGSLANNNDIAVVGGSLWACGSPNKIVLADASDPSAPLLVEEFSVYGSPTSIAVNDAVVAVAASYGGVLLFDAAQADRIVQLGRVDTYADGAFRAFGVAFDRNRLFVTGEWGGLRVYDVSDPQAPVLLTAKTDAGFLRLINVHNGRAYVLDASLPGVRVFDVANVSNPVEVGQVFTDAEPLRFDVDSSAAGTLLAVAEGSGGLEVFDVSNPAAPRFLSHAFGVNGVGGVVLDGATAFVGYMSAVVELDLTAPDDPRELAFVPLQAGLPAAQLRVSDGVVYAGFKGGVVAVLQR